MQQNRNIKIIKRMLIHHSFADFSRIKTVLLAGIFHHAKHGIGAQVVTQFLTVIGITSEVQNI